MNKELRKHPRFSLNKIAEYMLATPRRRRSLIIDQIRPPTAKVITYEFARRELVRFMCDPDRTSKRLLTAASAMRDRAADSAEEHRAKCLLCSARALESFSTFSDRVRPKGVVALAAVRRSADVVLGGVRIVVAPDVLLIEQGSERLVGVVKFHFSRSAPLRGEALQYAGTLVHRCLVNGGNSPVKAKCYSIDVFSGGVETVPRAIVDRMKNLEAACEEVAERWPVLLQQLASEVEQ